MNWKRYLATQQKIDWQRDFFDHGLRDHHEEKKKADYVLLNPVRWLITRTGRGRFLPFSIQFSLLNGLAFFQRVVTLTCSYPNQRLPMKNSRILPLFGLVLGFLILPTAFSADVRIAIEAVRTNSETQARLSWPAESGRQYDVLTTTNLGSGDWWSAALSIITPTNLIGEFQHSSTNRTHFFRVSQRDIRGPEITYRYPATNGIGVGRLAAMTVEVSDESGIDTNRFALTVNGVTFTTGSPGVTISSNRFQYVPSTNGWGDYGSTAVISFVCADLQGNVTLSSWSFAIEVQAVVTNVLLHLPPPPSGQGAFLAASAQQHGASFLEGLTVISFETNHIVFGYAGATHGLYTNAVLVSHDPSRIFYRRITGLVDDQQNQSVSVDTVDVPLTELIKDGTFSPETFLSADGIRAAAFGSPLQLDYSIPISYESEFTVLPLEFDIDGDDEEDLRITPGVLSLNLKGKAQVSCVIKDWRVVAFDASIDSQLAAEIQARFEFFETLAEFSRTRTLAKVPLAYVVGFIGPVPVWVELQLGVDLGFQARAEAALVVEPGLNAYATSNFRLAWRPGSFEHSYDGSFDFVPLTLDAGVEFSAEAFLYLKPRLSALVYSLAGVSADYRRGPALEAVYEVGKPQAEITLYDKWSINAGLTVVGVDDGALPEQTFVEERRTVRTWYWPNIVERPPAFTRHPSSVTGSAGTTIVLEASATGNPEPSYQWFQNGIGIPFETRPRLTFRMGSGATGSYHVIARNDRGFARSISAAVSLPASTPQPGMVWIPPGTFTMGSPLTEAERYTFEGPQTQVTISRGFWMGRFEVTQGEYLAVMGTNPSGFTGDLRLPVERVSWGDAVAYCRALTHRERNAGRLPAGHVYRLPTEAEWEYACRASTITAFHYGPALRSGMANFVGTLEYDASLGVIQNNSGISLDRTTPVGSYAPNAWGLYDMHGNVWEWCQDWWTPSLSGGSVIDPKGPQTGIDRVHRGAAYSYQARHLRSAYREGGPPAQHVSHVGFRVVLASEGPNGLAVNIGSGFANTVGIDLSGIADVANGVLKLTIPITSSYGAASFDFSLRNFENITARWKSLIGGGLHPADDRVGADGYSLNISDDLPVDPGYGGEDGIGNGLRVAVDTFDNGGGEDGLSIVWRGNIVAFRQIPKNDPGTGIYLRKNTFVNAEVILDTSGLCTFIYDGQIISASLSSYTGISANRALLWARTGGSDDNHWIDDFSFMGLP